MKKQSENKNFIQSVGIATQMATEFESLVGAKDSFASATGRRGMVTKITTEWSFA